MAGTFTPETTDYLSVNKYKILIHKYPNVEFFAQRIPIPTVTLGSTIQFTNREHDIKIPGDKVEYEDLIVSFIVDENMDTFKEILDWLQMAAADELAHDEIFSDISIISLTNNSNANKIFKFYNAWPQTITNILLDVTTTEDQPPTVDVIFKYTHFTLG